MKAAICMEKSMGKASFIVQMEMYMKENFKIIICMELGLLLEMMEENT